MMHFRVQFTNKGAPGVFVTEARDAQHARKNFYDHYPTGVIKRVKVDREAKP